MALIAPSSHSTGTRPSLQAFLDALLAEQGALDTPVARFAAQHATPGVLPAASQLIPLSAPKPDEQYAFQVDLDSCTGCKSCVAACHALNGLEESETWRGVGLLVGTDRRKPLTQTITSACHHCEDPACLNGCPVLAYEKDPLTGIVRHLDDQCIGCSYCVLKCPYDVPKYSHRLGIVRKCDMCHQRLAHGEAPACIQACPTEAIRITAVSRLKEAGIPAPTFLPGAPDPGYTRPTTRYISRRPMPAVVAADAAALRPQPAHWPLVGLLTLMPLGIGCLGADALFQPADVALTWVGWSAGLAGLLCSVAHLGRPLRAWRVFLGLRRSWLSREAVLLGVWFGAATVYVLQRSALLPFPQLAPAMGAAALAIGIAGLLCSVMIYVDTRREFWAITHTLPRFFGSMWVLGAAAALCVTRSEEGQDALAIATLVSILVKLLCESRALAPLSSPDVNNGAAHKTARLLAGVLRPIAEARIGCALVGAVVVPLLAIAHTPPSWVLWAGLAITAGGEFIERSLYFRAVVAPKMPGLPE